jgi:hypothetical protein
MKGMIPQRSQSRPQATSGAHERAARHGLAMVAKEPSAAGKAERVKLAENASVDNAVVSSLQHA